MRVKLGMTLSPSTPSHPFRKAGRHSMGVVCRKWLWGLTRPRYAYPAVNKLLWPRPRRCPSISYRRTSSMLSRSYQHKKRFNLSAILNCIQDYTDEPVYLRHKHQRQAFQIFGSFYQLELFDSVAPKPWAELPNAHSGLWSLCSVVDKSKGMDFLPLTVVILDVKMNEACERRL
ncbi:MFS efflux pump atnC [Fusarium oxysporum f. sp. albedinis]|nr:MFS efflux pump atnC [Fusarium oxysporum f. sp. albedinis]